MPDLKHYTLALFRALVLIALVFSVALYVHYLDPANSGFCSGRSGCEAVRHSEYSYLFGEPALNLPLVGVVSFSVLFTFSLLPMRAESRGKLLGACAALGALSAVAFIVIQAVVIDAFCWLCMVVDGSAIAAGICGAALWMQGNTPQRPVLNTWAWAAAAGVLVIAPIGSWQTRPGLAIPEGVSRLYQPGKINVVEFADFQCSYCRTMYRIFDRLNREYGERVNFHQLHMPLPGHGHSMTAASAAVCAEAQGKDAEMKRLLFTRALVDDFARKHAEELQLDMSAFEECLDSAATAQRIEADRTILREAGFTGLPTTFVGQQRIVGWRVYPAMKEAYEAALLDEAPFSVPPIAYWIGVAVALAGLSWAGRSRGNGVAAS